MVRAILKGLHSPDVADLERYVPAEDDRFGFLLQLLVGPEGADGEESVDVMVVTPRWLADRVGDEPMSLAHHVLVTRYDFPTLRRWLERRVERCVGESWDEVEEQLRRLGHWEFDGYVD